MPFKHSIIYLPGNVNVPNTFLKH